MKKLWPKWKWQIFLQETQEQELQDQDDLDDSLLEPERKKKNKLIYFCMIFFYLFNFFCWYELQNVIRFRKRKLICGPSVTTLLVCYLPAYLSIYLLFNI